MVFAKTRTWYASVGFGGNPAPKGPWGSPEQAVASLRRWLARMGVDAGEAVNRNVIRVHGYETRQYARDADISDTLDENGCIEIHGLYDFLDLHIQPEEES